MSYSFEDTEEMVEMSSEVREEAMDAAVEYARAFRRIFGAVNEANIIAGAVMVVAEELKEANENLREIWDQIGCLH